MADREHSGLSQAPPIVGYADRLSLVAGDVVNVMVSCADGGSFDSALVRLICGDRRRSGAGFAEELVAGQAVGRHRGRFQPIHPGSYAHTGRALPALAGLQVDLLIWPTLPDAGRQCVLAWGAVRLVLEAGRLQAECGDTVVAAQLPLQARRWHEVHLAWRADGGTLTVTCRGEGSGERATTAASAALPGLPAQPPAPLCLAADLQDNVPRSCFNGRIEAPAVAELAAAGTPRWLARWDFAADMAADSVADTTGHGYQLQLVNTPTRAVCGAAWDGSVQNPALAPAHYGAIAFHADDLTDARWQPDLTWTVPPDLPSGIYAIRLTHGDAVDHVPLFVRPAPHHQRRQVALLMSTATYLAYANQRLMLSGGIFGDPTPKNPNDAWLAVHPEVGGSLYETHADGSGVHFSSHLRPVMNLKPGGTMWSFNADTNISAWLEHEGAPFDVITDHDLHLQGADALAGYRAVITGTHPEYYSTPMLDGLRSWLDAGSHRLMYMGGNGFYWRIAWHPDNPAIIEVRRAEDGTRAWIAEPGEYHHAFNGEYGGMWRRLGHPPNQLVGVGFAAQGFDGATHYRVHEGARDESRVAFAFAEVSGDTHIGGYGSVEGGAAGQEIDRHDVTLGSPRHAVILASSEDHRPGMLRVKEEFLSTLPPQPSVKVRADMTFFETPSGGAVFSTGSISYAGSLAHNGYDNDIARITTNVLRRFMDPEPFAWPLPDGQDASG